tara:strand:- start:205 stop:474 length:270 start_codon:yes stop_codon:yes gene_type:complete
MTTESTETKTENTSQDASVAVQPVVMCDADRIALLQYESLRENFTKLIDSVLGPDYYNMGMDVYECDRICCEDIAIAAKKNWWQRLTNT